MKILKKKDVIIQNKKTRARYFGKVVGFRDQESRFYLSVLAILNKNGDVVAPKYRNVRWFDSDKFSLKEYQFKQQMVEQEYV